MLLKTDIVRVCSSSRLFLKKLSNHFSSQSYLLARNYLINYCFSFNYIIKENLK